MNDEMLDLDTEMVHDQNRYQLINNKPSLAKLYVQKEMKRSPSIKMTKEFLPKKGKSPHSKRKCATDVQNS